MSKVTLLQLWRRLAATLVLLAGFIIAPSAYAGVGMLGGGESLYNSDLGISGGNTIWDGTRQRNLSACKRRNANLIQGYEYGYSYFYTLFASATIAYRKCGEITRSKRVNRVTGNITPAQSTLGGRSQGLGDVSIGMRARLNHANTAAWEVSMIIPTGYDGNSPASLGRGALGMSLGIKFASDGKVNKKSSWAWNLGSKFNFFFASKGNSIASFVSLSYAFTETNFEQTGNFLSLRISNSVALARNGVQQQLFYNQVPSSLTSSDITALTLGYSHAFPDGWSTNLRVGKGLFGRSSPIDYNAGWGVSYRWED